MSIFRLFVPRKKTITLKNRVFTIEASFEKIIGTMGVKIALSKKD